MSDQSRAILLTSAYSMIENYIQTGDIDNTSHLASSKVYNFHGTKDFVIIESSEDL